MSHAYNSKEGAAYLIDPLNAPEPSQETGLGSHFGSTMPHTTTSEKGPRTAASPVSPGSSANPFRKSSVSGKEGHSRTTSRELHHGSPVGGSKPFPKYRESAFGELNEPRRHSGSSGEHITTSHNHGAGESSHHRRRTSSLKERFPGDSSHQPLEVLRRDSKKAHRSPHLQRRHIPGADTIDRLDPTLNSVPYHHEGPYDAAMLARNTSFESSPVAAVAGTNREALKATPAENIRDALERGKPIEGVAIVPPGEMDRLGRVYNYEEGTDMMRDPNAPGGGYKQLTGTVGYPTEDVNGTGESTFALDRALRAHSIQDREYEDEEGYEMATRSHRGSRDHKHLDGRDPVEVTGEDSSHYASASGSQDVHPHESMTTSLKKSAQGLKKRMSIKKKYREIHNGEVD